MANITDFAILVTLTFAAELTFIGSVKIIVIPGAMVSHCLESMSVGKELLNRGHHVTLFAHLFDPSSCIARFDIDQNTPRFKVVSPEVDTECAKKHKYYFDQLEKGLSIFQVLFTVATPMRINMCNSAFSDKRVIKELEEDKYDIAIVDGVVVMNCIASLAVHLDVPFVSIGTYLDSYATGVPLQSNTFPLLLGQVTNEMAFPRRILNTILHFIQPLTMRFLFSPIDMSQFSDRLKGVDTNAIIAESVLFLENSNYIIDYPKALFPNYVQVGALTATPPKRLPTELQTYMDASKQGVIVIAFGSVLKDISPRVFENIMNAMQRFTENVLMKYKTDHVRDNIRTMKWIPQNDVLGHRNAKLFVSHCGKNSLWEGIYHGIPIICVPLATDGFSNAGKVKHYKVGLSLNILEADADEIYGTVREVLENETFRHNMKKMSAILRDTPETSPQKAATAIEHVIKYGDSHLRPPSVGYITHTYADVWLTILCASALIIYFDIWLCKRFCCRGRGGRKEKSD